MLDHMTLRVADIARTREFYQPLMRLLGYGDALQMEHDGVHILGFAHDGKYDTWFVQSTAPGACHICWRVDNRAAVDAFYQAALAAGGKDNGAPGLRPHYHQHYYGAFVIDPDGNNIEAVCHQAQ
ncbi:MAG: VOC family protein [Burkholderiales bacterium]|nr:VOC family protein [Burkholderiales bacterium]